MTPFADALTRHREAYLRGFTRDFVWLWPEYFDKAESDFRCLASFQLGLYHRARRDAVASLRSRTVSRD